MDIKEIEQIIQKNIQAIQSDSDYVSSIDLYGNVDRIRDNTNTIIGLIQTWIQLKGKELA